jgi:DNA-binding transcriptional regulator GbsR (MarR family)
VSTSERFIEVMGLMFQDTGDTRIAGRLFALLVIEGRELSLQQMSERLGVSRASVSTNARQLAKRGAIRLTAHPGDRQDFYELNNFPSVDVVSELAERMVRQAQAVQDFVEPMRLENELAADRIGDLSRAFGQAAKLLNDWGVALRNDHTFRKNQT